MKNNTYYEGKPYLKVEKNPYYTGQSKLNKVHLNLGFCKLVSRVSSKKYNEDLLIDMALQQGVKLRSCYSNNFDSDFQYITYDKDKGYPCYFLIDDDKTYLGVDEVFMCYKNNMRIIGHGLSKVLDSADNVIGYYGYSHRGGQAFKIGDMIYDANFVMDEFHPSYKKYKKILNKSKYASRVENVVPFVEHGNIKIESLEQAKEAALNLRRELS